MVHIVHTGVPAEPRRPIRAEACHAALAKLRATVASRPNYQPLNATALALKRPACEHLCITCYMACAIAPERIAWRENELASAEAYEAGLALEYGGAIFLEPAGMA